MNVINEYKDQKGFTPVSNASLRDRRLSAAARGILAYLLSHNGNLFNVTRRTLMAEFSLSTGKVTEFLSELRKFGYLDTSKARRGEDGTLIGRDWTIYGVSVLPGISGEPKKRKAANATSFSLKDSNRNSAKPNDGENERPLNQTTDLTGNIKDNNFKERTIEEEGGAESSGLKQNLTPGFHKKTFSNQFDLSAEFSAKDNIEINSAVVGIKNDSDSGSLVWVGADSNSKTNKEIPDSIRIYRELHIKNHFPSKNRTKKDIETNEPSDWEKIVTTVAAGTENLWREAIVEYKTQAVEKGWAKLDFVQGFIDRYLNKIERARFAAKTNKPEQPKNHVNPETGLGYA